MMKNKFIYVYCIFVSEPTKNEGMHMCYLGFILFHQFLTLFDVIISFSEGRFRGSQWENPNIWTPWVFNFVLLSYMYLSYNKKNYQYKIIEKERKPCKINFFVLFLCYLFAIFFYFIAFLNCYDKWIWENNFLRFSSQTFSKLFWDSQNLF